MTGIINIFVDELFGASGTETGQRVLARLRKEFQVGSEDSNDVTFTRQRIRWMKDPLSCIEVSHEKAIEELEEISRPIGVRACPVAPSSNFRYRI